MKYFLALTGLFLFSLTSLYSQNPKTKNKLTIIQLEKNNPVNFLNILKNKNCDNSQRLTAALKLKDCATKKIVADLINLFNNEQSAIIKESIADILIKLTQKHHLYNNLNLLNILFKIIQIKDYNNTDPYRINNKISTITKHNALIEISEFKSHINTEQLESLCKGYSLTKNDDCKKVAAYSILSILNNKISKKKILENKTIYKTIKNISLNKQLPQEYQTYATSLLNFNSTVL
jgi:hypothetical protein